MVCQHYRVAHTSGSALTSGFLLASPGWPAPPKETKRSSPDIRPQLRRGSLATSLLRGHASKGHPWPIAALAASMPLNPLRNDSTRPSEGANWCRLLIFWHEEHQKNKAAEWPLSPLCSQPGKTRQPLSSRLTPPTAPRATPRAPAPSADPGGSRHPEKRDDAYAPAPWAPRP